jgi:hypothetical protein
MNDRETRCLFNKYRRIDVIFINRFFHFCAFCAFAKTSFHSTSFVRLQTYLTKWCRESFFSSNSLDNDVMIMRLIKIFDVHDKQFMFKQRMSDKMIEWWEKKNDEKMLFYVQNYSFIFSHATSLFISFMIIDLRFRYIIFEQWVFLTSFSTDNENFFRFSFNIKTNIRIR